MNEALVFLQYLYAADAGQFLSSNIEHAKIVASFAHKFAMASVLDHCDRFLAAKVQDVHVRFLKENFIALVVECLRLQISQLLVGLMSLVITTFDLCLCRTLLPSRRIWICSFLQKIFICQSLQAL